MIFEQVISLGGLCQATYQIKERFGFNAASPFDWLVTPLSALKTIFQTNGSRFGMAVHCETHGEAAARKGYSVFCSEYRVAYQHEFVRDEDKRPIVTEEGLAACRAKLSHKYEKMDRSLKENRPTLFIRFVGHHDGLSMNPNSDDPRPVLSDELNELVETISVKYPDLPFRLAFVYLRARTALFDTSTLDERIITFGLAETVHAWQGETAEWDKVFSSFAFDLGRTEHAKLEYLL